MAIRRVRIASFGILSSRRPFKRLVVLGENRADKRFH